MTAVPAPAALRPDVVIVGAGPAGLRAAAALAATVRDVLVLERESEAGGIPRHSDHLGYGMRDLGRFMSGPRYARLLRDTAVRAGATIRTEAMATGWAGPRSLHVTSPQGLLRVDARAVVLATGASYRRLPLDDLADYEGVSVFYAVGPPEAQSCGASRVAVVGGGNSAGQAAVWLARGGALVTLIHRRANLGETMSDYLIHELDRYGVAVRDRSEIAALHGANGQLEAVTLKSGEQLPFTALFFFLGAEPCTEWLDDAVARAADGFIVTGDTVGADSLLETSVPGIFAAGDVRSGSSKRCAAAVGEGSMAVQFVHQHLARPTARVP